MTSSIADPTRTVSQNVVFHSPPIVLRYPRTIVMSKCLTAVAHSQPRTRCSGDFALACCLFFDEDTRRPIPESSDLIGASVCPFNHTHWKILFLFRQCRCGDDDIFSRPLPYDSSVSHLNDEVCNRPRQSNVVSLLEMNMAKHGWMIYMNSPLERLCVPVPALLEGNVPRCVSQ